MTHTFLLNRNGGRKAQGGFGFMSRRPTDGQGRPTDGQLLPPDGGGGSGGSGGSGGDEGDRAECPPPAADEWETEAWWAEDVTVPGSVRTRSKRGSMEEAAMAAAVVPSMPLPPPPQAGRACIPCRKIHVRCDCKTPCGRCFRLSLHCLQPVRKPYSRRRRQQLGGDGQGAGSSDESQDGATKRKRPRAKKILTVDVTPLRDLIIARSDPGANAAVYLRAFNRLVEEGRVVKGWVIAMMRMWRTWSLAAGVDVTWGILDGLSHALGVDLVEVEGKEALRWGMTAERRVQRAQETLARVAHLSKGLQDMPLFREADDGITGTTLAILGPGRAPKEEEGKEDDDDDDPAAIYCMQTFNAPLAAMLNYSAAEASRGTIQYKAIQILNWVAFMAPEDREQFLSFQQELMFSDTAFVSGICKASYGDGQVRLYVFRARKMELDGDGAGKRLGLLYQVEPCPTSRHLTDMPEALKTRPFKFHQPYQAPPSVTSTSHSTAPGQQPPSSAAAAAASEAGAPVRLPGLAAIVQPGPTATAAEAVAAQGAALASSDEGSRIAAGVFQRKPRSDAPGVWRRANEGRVATASGAMHPSPSAVAARPLLAGAASPSLPPPAAPQPQPQPQPLPSAPTSHSLALHSLSFPGAQRGAGEAGADGGAEQQRPRSVVPVFDEDVLESIFFD